MKLSVLDNALWGADFVFHFVLLLSLLIRRTLKGFSVFIALLGWELLNILVAFFVSKYGTGHAYFLVYWIGGYLDYVLQFAVVIKIAREVLRPARWWLRESRKGILIWGLLGIVGAASVSLGIGQAGVKLFDLWENRASVFISLLLCGMLVFVTSIAGFLQLYKARHVTALINGLFLWSYSVLLQDVADAVLRHHNETIAYIVGFLYNATFIYWIVVFWEPEKPPPPPSAEMMAYMLALHEQVKYDLETLKGPRQ
jgi:hypothetical protein